MDFNAFVICDSKENHKVEEWDQKYNQHSGHILKLGISAAAYFKLI